VPAWSSNCLGSRPARAASVIFAQLRIETHAAEATPMHRRGQNRITTHRGMVDAGALSGEVRAATLRALRALRRMAFSRQPYR
jgi:hypothetical protein